MNILIVTGRLARGMIEKLIEPIRREFRDYMIKLYVIPVDVISLVKPITVYRYLSRINLEDVDLVIIPGTLKGDYTDISRRIGVKIVKSPSNPTLLRAMFLIGPKKFSPREPGERIIEKHYRRILDEAIKHYTGNAEGLAIGDLEIPYNPPPFIIGYYFNHKWGRKWLLGYISKYNPDLIYIPQGIDCGIVEELASMGYDKRIAITPEMLGRECYTRYASIIYGVRADKVEEYSSIGYIVNIYIDDEEGNIHDRISSIPRDRVVVDLGMPGYGSRRLLEKLSKYSILREYASSAWITNTLSSIDADTHSQIPLLLELLGEAGVSLVLIHESEEKLFWTLRETVKARDLLTLSWYLGSDPRDLGIDLLYVKDKIYTWIEYPEPDEVVECSDNVREYIIDPMGIFKIRVNHVDGYIEALYIGRKGKILFRGRSEEGIRYEIIDRGLVSRFDHAFYLGRELGKAEEALRMGINYEQEKPLIGRGRDD